MKNVLITFKSWEVQVKMGVQLGRTPLTTTTTSHSLPLPHTINLT